MNTNNSESNKTPYICEGSCNAQITQKQYKKGLIKCGAKTCNLYGKPFKKT